MLITEHADDVDTETMDLPYRFGVAGEVCRIGLFRPAEEHRIGLEWSQSKRLDDDGQRLHCVGGQHGTTVHIQTELFDLAL